MCSGTVPQNTWGLQVRALLHLLTPGLCASPAQTDCLEFQVWDRGNSTGQFPATRPLSLGRVGLLPCHLVAAAELCWVLTSAGAATVPSVSGFLLERRPKAHACLVWYFLPDRPNNVSECATENIPVLGCRGDRDSLFPCCLQSAPLSTHCKREGSFQSSGSAFLCLARKIKGLVKL